MEFNEYVNQGIVFFQKKEYESAINYLEAAQKLEPDNMQVQEIIRMVEESVKIEKKESQALLDEASNRAASMGIKDVDKAIAEYAEYLKCNPNDASVKSDLAIAYYIRGLTFLSRREYAQAIADYTDAIKLEPNYPFAIYKRGSAYLDNGDFSKAITDFEELLRLNPNDHEVEEYIANAHMQSGIANDQKGEYERAIKDWEAVLKYKPDDSETKELIHMARKELAGR